MDSRMAPATTLLLLVIHFFADTQGTNHASGSPCTTSALRAGRMYHANPADRRTFIQCDAFGRSYVLHCPHGQEWDARLETCMMAAPAPPPAQLRRTDQRQADLLRSLPDPSSMYAPPPMEDSVQYEPVCPDGYTFQEKTQLCFKQMSSMANSVGINDYPPPAMGSPMLHFIVMAAQGGGMQGGGMQPPPTQMPLIPLPTAPPPTAPPPMPMPTQATTLEGLGDHNPCSLTSSRFHPYPADPSSYLECQAMWRVVLWSCGDGQMWSQELQGCTEMNMNMGNNMGNDIGNDMGNEREAGDGNPCHHTTSYYHPYYADEEKFIQCDQFGNMFIQRCGPKKIWDDYYKTCVGHNEHIELPKNDKEPNGNNVAESAGRAESGSAGMAGGGAGMAGGGAGMTGAREGPVNTKDNFAAGGNMGGNLQCPESYELDPESRLCIKQGPGGAVMYTHSCPANYRYDTSSSLCVEVVGSKNCDMGMTWLDNLGMCVPESFGRGTRGAGQQSLLEWLAVQAGGWLPQGWQTGPEVDSSSYSTEYNAAYGYNDGMELGNAYEGARQGAPVRKRKHIEPAPLPAVHVDHMSSVDSGPRMLAMKEYRRDHVKLPPMDAMQHGYDNKGYDNKGPVISFNNLDPNQAKPALPEYSTPVVYDGENPCGTLNEDDEAVYFFPFPLDPTFYIQCDQTGNMFIQPCDVGELWNQDMSTCVPDMQLSSDSAVDIHHAADNPCPGSDWAYFPFPNNDQLFLMCVGDVAYPMACPAGSFWDDMVSTCTYTPAPEYDDYEDDYSEEPEEEYKMEEEYIVAEESYEITSEDSGDGEGGCEPGASYNAMLDLCIANSALSQG